MKRADHMERKLQDLMNASGESSGPSVIQKRAKEASLEAFRESQRRRRGQRRNHCLLAAVLLFFAGVAATMLFRSPTIDVRPITLLDSRDARELLHQGREIFGNTVDAVVISQSETEWVLTKTDRKSNAPYYLIHFTDPGSDEQVSVIATSGSRFSVHSHYEWEVLERNNGSLFLAGQNLVVEPDVIQSFTSPSLRL